MFDSSLVVAPTGSLENKTSAYPIAGYLVIDPRPLLIRVTNYFEAGVELSHRFVPFRVATCRQNFSIRERPNSTRRSTSLCRFGKNRNSTSIFANPIVKKTIASLESRQLMNLVVQCDGVRGVAWRKFRGTGEAMARRSHLCWARDSVRPKVTMMRPTSHRIDPEARLGMMAHHHWRFAPKYDADA